MMNYSRFLNRISRARKPNLIRVITAILQESPAGTISMAGGLPNVDLFPYKHAQLTLSDGTVLELANEQMKQALQYGATQGLGPLVSWVRNLQKHIHDPPTMRLPSDDPRSLDICITTGGQDGLCKAFEAMLNKGDNLLMEAPSYPGALSAVLPLSPNVIPIATDAQGMDPNILQDALSKWRPSDKDNSESNLPRVLYCVPNGGNPTGHGLTYERKCEIYKLAQEYDILILEDDPYFYLQFTKPHIPSFLSMDVDGRVLRFDTFSKLLSSGVRVGFVTGPKALVERIMLHMQASVLHNSTVSQMLVYKVLEHWGLDGFLKHTDKVADFYLTQRDHALRAAEKHLTGLADWNAPSGGMFLWLKIHGIKDTYQLILEKALQKGVLFLPGAAFSVDSTEPSPYLRASYSLTTPEQMDEAFSRLADLIREEQKSDKPS